MGYASDMSDITIIGQSTALNQDCCKITYLADGVEYYAVVSFEMIDECGGLREALTQMIAELGHDTALTAVVRAEMQRRHGTEAAKALRATWGNPVTERLAYRQDGDPVAYSGYAMDIPANVAAKMWDQIATTAEQQVQNPHLRKMMAEIVGDHVTSEASGRVLTLYDNPKPLEPKTYKRVDKIAKY